MVCIPKPLSRQDYANADVKMLELVTKAKKEMEEMEQNLRSGDPGYFNLQFMAKEIRVMMNDFADETYKVL